MAAVNLFIRGLNPHNIEQGDSLKMFAPANDAGSKSIVIANPPFGAERDQSAYPNVWEEYPKESETTILFVKLMFDYLKKGGRCAVIVSEGFLTWDQNSARTLRKMLLEEVNLKAIISLPQGVFVSKGGQGAKTSILYFEKGEPTKSIWYYKIENDGFAMGVNRKQIQGSQIPEVVELFAKFVKKGILPPETSNSFVIPAEWIKTLDPRIKERIRTETCETLTERSKEKRAELAAKLDERVTEKKIDEETRKQKLWEFDTNLENKILNEISKNIERAHSYSFNLQNYRSNLRKEQITEWNSVCQHSGSRKLELADRQATHADMKSATTTLDSLFHRLHTADAKTALQILFSLDPTNALEMDIAREYLSKESHNDKTLLRLNDLLKRGFAYPRVKLGNFLMPKYEKIKKEDYKADVDIVEKIRFNDGATIFREERKTGMDLYKAVKGDLVTSKINVHQGAAAIAPTELVCSTHYQTYKINTSEVVPSFLVDVLRTPQFLAQLSDEKNKGIKNEQGAEFLLGFTIPLPSPEIQREIVEKIEKQKAIIEGAEKILVSFVPIIEIKKDWKHIEIGSLCKIEYGDALPEKDRIDGEYPVVGAGAIIGSHNKYLTEGPAIIIGRRGATSGGILWIEKSCFPIDTAFFVKDFDAKKVQKKFLYYTLKYANLGSMQNGGAMPGVNRTDIYQTKIFLPDLEVQKQIVEDLDQEMEAVEKIRLLKTKAQQRIKQILSEVWGEDGG